MPLTAPRFDVFERAAADCLRVQSFELFDQFLESTDVSLSLVLLIVI